LYTNGSPNSPVTIYTHSAFDIFFGRVDGWRGNRRYWGEAVCRRLSPCTCVSVHTIIPSPTAARRTVHEVFPTRRTGIAFFRLLYGPSITHTICSNVHQSIYFMELLIGYFPVPVLPTVFLLHNKLPKSSVGIGLYRPILSLNYYHFQQHRTPGPAAAQGARFAGIKQGSSGNPIPARGHVLPRQGPVQRGGIHPASGGA